MSNVPAERIGVPRRGIAASRPTDVRVVAATLYFLPVETRVPLKFGAETLTSVTCARVCVTVEGRDGRRETGWGETPLSVQWVWPDDTPYEVRHVRLRGLCVELARRWGGFAAVGHPLEVGHAFVSCELAAAIDAEHTASAAAVPIPELAGLVCCSPFDIALYDAFGRLHGRPVFELLGEEHLATDLAAYLEPDADALTDFVDKRPSDFLAPSRPDTLLAWHLVGGLDPITAADLTGAEPRDGEPVMLHEWIERDGLECLKVKLRGTDAPWDYARLCAVGDVAVSRGVRFLTADYNCTVTDPRYVVAMLDRLATQRPDLFDRLLYVEQPFPYDLPANRIDVREVSRRKLLLLDESAHDWRMVRLGRSLGWTGVALKTCKTLTGSLLSLAWAKGHGMAVMVQDLTNPMLAHASHALFAAHCGTLMGVETNAMQFYPAASAPEAAVHPGLYRRRGGRIDLSTLRGPGIGYRIDEVRRELPPAAARFG